MNMPGIDEIDNLLKQYELQQREVYINRTVPAIDQLEDIAYRLADAYEMEYRANPTYENEERMRYWRYMGAKHWNSKGDGKYITPYTEYNRRKKEYEELVRKHREASEPANEERHKKLKVHDKNIRIFAGLLGLTIGIHVLIHIFFTLAS